MRDTVSRLAETIWITERLYRASTLTSAMYASVIAEIIRNALLFSVRSDTEQCEAANTQLTLPIELERLPI